MTDTTARHLDLDSLADSVAGEADGAATAHLAGCRSCTSRLRELEAAERRVAAVLSTLPPPALPADLADRLSAALAEQAPLEATAPSTGASVTALPAREASRRRTWLPAAAAAVLLASGAGIGWSMLAGGTGDDADSAAGSAPLVSASGADYADAAALAASLPAVLAGGAQGAATTFSSESRGAGAVAGSGSGSADAEGSTDESATTAQVPAPAAEAVVPADPLERLRTTDGLAACLAGLQDDGEVVAPLALDYASYSGAPALAVLLPDPDPAKVAVFVVGPACTQADPQLLHYVRVDRPE